MKRLLLVGLAAITGWSSPALARLVSQKVHNGVRACVFEDLLGLQEQLDIKAEEVCPAYAHERRDMATAPVEIPSLATLRREERRVGGAFCVYALNGVEYRRSISATGICPYTPN